VELMKLIDGTMKKFMLIGVVYALFVTLIDVICGLFKTSKKL
jgi:hypothetical protein